MDPQTMHPRKQKARAVPRPGSQARSDLTGYAALLGDSFSSRVDLLEKVIQSSHYPSLGRYKERLLVKLIRDYIPRTFDVGTGFVLFPHEDTSPPGGPEHHDPLNRSAFAVSRQCDILVFDSNVPPVFRDDDFVVVRPEAVRAVIEVKGSLNLEETASLLESFYTFGKNWRTTQRLYKSHHQGTAPIPTLIGMAWRMKTKRGGRPETTPTRVRETIAEFYKTRLQRKHTANFPVLDHLYIYNECEISRGTWFDDKSDRTLKDGWLSSDGRFIRFGPSRSPYRDKDKTIASLLAVLHYATARDTFNRFFSYTDETHRVGVVPYEHCGHSLWFEIEPRTKSNTESA